MLDTMETCGCVQCYTVIRSGCERRILPWVLQAGHIGRQSRTAYIYFDGANHGCIDPRLANLRIFIPNMQLCTPQAVVCIRAVLPCGAPLPIEENAAFEVNRHLCGWRSVDIQPLYKAVRRELGDAPFGFMLSMAMPSFVAFSAEPATRPRLLLDWQPPDGSPATPHCPCTNAVDVCAPMNCGCCHKGRSEIRVENQTWAIEFEGRDSSVLRRVDQMKQGTFFVTNEGADDMLAVMETGFDDDRWAPDTQRSVAPGETLAIVAKFFGRYYRMTLTTPGAGKASVAFIGQYYT